MKPELARPLRFSPNLQTVIWGGNRIAEYKNISTTLDHVGESWEISAVPGKESVVAEGELKGLSISRLAEAYGEDLLGSRVIEAYGCRFPLLIKFIDATSDLSFQVHPDDELAQSRHNAFGKSEMWYIIDALPGSLISLGFRHSLDADSYRRHVEEATFCDTVASYPSHPGDTFYIPAGRVHAIGAGNFLVEIQQSSDITYRIYDYDRRDRDGKPRELHTELAGEALDFTIREDYRNYPIKEDDNIDRIISCNHFTVKRIQLNDTLSLAAAPGSFTVLMCIGGECTIDTGSGSEPLRQGETVLIAASVASILLSGSASLLHITV